LTQAVLPYLGCLHTVLSGPGDAVIAQSNSISN